MAEKLGIKDFVAKNNNVYFDSFRAGVFYYRVYKADSCIGYLFQVPIEDVGGATLLAEDKSITYMRWIRKSIEDGTFIKYK
jgi:hypothetical protein